MLKLPSVRTLPLEDEKEIFPEMEPPTFEEAAKKKQERFIGRRFSSWMVFNYFIRTYMRRLRDYRTEIWRVMQEETKELFM